MRASYAFTGFRQKLLKTWNKKQELGGVFENYDKKKKIKFCERVGARHSSAPVDHCCGMRCGCPQRIRRRRYCVGYFGVGRHEQRHELV